MVGSSPLVCVCVCVCVLLLTVGVSVGVVRGGATGVEREGGGAMLVVSGCVMIEEEEGEGEGEGVVEERTSMGEGVDAMGVSTTVKFSMTRTPEPDMFNIVTLSTSVILSMSVIFSVGSTEGVGDMVGMNDCVEVGLGKEDVSLFWARMTGHRTRRRRRGEESSSDRTIFNLERGNKGR